MDVFDLAAKITLDDKEYNSKLDGAFSKLNTVGSKISSGIATAAKVGAVAIGAAATSVGVLVTKSVEAYSNYEQLVGGVQKLYGNMGMSLEEYAKTQGKTSDEVKKDWERNEQAAETMMKNANNAFKTAGMSANQYMEVATSFSASLIGSLKGDTLEAAKMTDKAMTAISDNWNTFGGDLGMIQGAFQGFAKQNYTMLDNLKLGYGGTKQEMQRLIADANTYAKSIGEASNLSIDSFADIVTAIELVQKKQQIYGTTAREASTTIQGSLGMVKAAWENMITGMSNKEADLDTLMSNLVDAVAGYTDSTGQHVNGLIDNILPVVEKALESVATFIDRMAPVLVKRIPDMITQILPTLLKAGADIVEAIMQGIYETAPMMVETGLNMLKTLLDGIAEGGMEAKESGKSVIEQIMDSIRTYLPDILWAGQAIIGNLIDGMADSLPQIMSYITEILMMIGNTIINYGPSMMTSATDLILAFIEGIDENLDQIVDKAVTIIEILAGGIAENLPKIIDSAVDLIIHLAEALTDPNTLDSLIESAVTIMKTLATSLVGAVDKLAEKVPEILSALYEAFKRHPELINAIAPFIMLKIAGGIVTNIPAITTAVTQIIPVFTKVFGEGGTLVTMGTKFSGFFTNSIIPALSSVGTFITGTLIPAIGGFISTLGSIIVAAAPVIAALGLVVAAGVLIYKNWDEIKEAGRLLVERTKEHFENLKNAVSEKWNNMKQTISNAWDNVKNKTANVWDNIKQKIEQNGGGIKGIINTYVEGYKNLWQGAFNKINEVTGGKLGEALKTISEKLGNIKEAFDEKIKAAADWGKDMIENFVSGIKEKISKVADAAREVASTIKDILGFSEPDEGPLSNFHTFAPDMMDLFIKGVKDNTQKLQDQIEKSFDFGNAIINANVSASSGMQQTGNMVPITMNIYGTEGQNVRELADLVSDRLLHQIGQTGAVYA